MQLSLRCIRFLSFLKQTCLPRDVNILWGGDLIPVQDDTARYSKHKKKNSERKAGFRKKIVPTFHCCKLKEKGNMVFRFKSVVYWRSQRRRS